jgi:hypothetical protein
VSGAGEQKRSPAAFLIVLLLAVQLVVVDFAEARATLLPPSIRLAILFQRVPWQPSAEVTTPIPPGHIIERWEL